MVLTLKDIYAGYGGADILRGVSLTVEQGSLTCIVGPNGAGKSTVLRTISGVIRPRRGLVQFGGVTINGFSPRRILEMGILQVPQERSLFPQLTVQENVRLGGFILKDTRLVERRLGAVMERFPLVKERAKELAGSLSGGQQKLVEFARCFMLDPKLILLDEPSMGLDPQTFKQVFAMVREIHAEGVTVLMVEQNTKSGLEIATHGVVMEGGMVRLDGPSQDVLHHPRIGQLFLGGTLTMAK
ncbi:MAG: ABC transporter ATP-binding protein [Firmicutes bacterium]|nr:ABC transporter ATP-binding protein [Bacillota bacterium]